MYKPRGSPPPAATEPVLIHQDYFERHKQQKRITTNHHINWRKQKLCSSLCEVIKLTPGDFIPEAVSHMVESSIFQYRTLSDRDRGQTNK